MTQRQIQNPYSDIVLGKIPSWITRWGTIVIFLLLIALTVLFHFVHYPQIITRQIHFIESFSAPTTNKNAGYKYIKGLMKINPDEVINIKQNMNINIKLSAYNSNEYGIIKGVVGVMDYSELEMIYIVSISLPDGLTTSRGVEIDYFNGMTGTGNIVIHEATLLSYILLPIKELFRK